jgi:hypothetical protein
MLCYLSSMVSQRSAAVPTRTCTHTPRSLEDIQNRSLSFASLRLHLAGDCHQRVPATTAIAAVRAASFGQYRLPRQGTTRSRLTSIHLYKAESPTPCIWARLGSHLTSSLWHRNQFRANPFVHFQRRKELEDLTCSPLPLSVRDVSLLRLFSLCIIFKSHESAMILS